MKLSNVNYTEADTNNIANNKRRKTAIFRVIMQRLNKVHI